MYIHKLILCSGKTAKQTILEKRKQSLILSILYLTTLPNREEEGYYTNSVFRAADKEMENILHKNDNSEFVIEITSAQACQIKKDGDHDYCLSNV